MTSAPSTPLDTARDCRSGIATATLHQHYIPVTSCSRVFRFLTLTGRLSVFTSVVTTTEAASTSCLVTWDVDAGPPPREQELAVRALFRRSSCGLLLRRCP